MFVLKHARTNLTGQWVALDTSTLPSRLENLDRVDVNGIKTLVEHYCGSRPSDVKVTQSIAYPQFHVPAMIAATALGGNVVIVWSKEDA